MGSIINDVQLGQDTRINIQSYSHGRKRVPMAGTLSFMPKETTGVVGEFDNRYGVTVYHALESVDVKMDITQSDQNDVDAMIMDKDPASTYLGFDEAQKSKNVIWCNYMGKNRGYLYQADYAEGLVSGTSDSSSDITKPTKRAYAWVGIRHVRIAAKTGSSPLGIQYNRFVHTPAFATADDIALTGGSFTNGVFPYAPQTVNNVGPNGVDANYIQCLYNGVPFTNFTITGTALVIGQTTVAGDVIEFWTPAAANVS